MLYNIRAIITYRFHGVVALILIIIHTHTHIKYSRFVLPLIIDFLDQTKIFVPKCRKNYALGYVAHDIGIK